MPAMMRAKTGRMRPHVPVPMLHRMRMMRQHMLRQCSRMQTAMPQFHFQFQFHLQYKKKKHCATGRPVRLASGRGQRLEALG